MSEQSQNVHRKMLAASISSSLLDLGIETADRDALGTLTEMLQCCESFDVTSLTFNEKIFFCIFAVLVEVGYLSRNYCELAGRAEPIIADVILGFVEMG